MMSLIDRWVELGQSKVNEIGATGVSGAMMADGIDSSFTLSDWSTILGMIYVLSMLIPRIIQFGKWLYNKWETRNGTSRGKETSGKS